MSAKNAINHRHFVMYSNLKSAVDTTNRYRAQDINHFKGAAPDRGWCGFSVASIRVSVAKSLFLFVSGFSNKLYQLIEAG